MPNKDRIYYQILNALKSADRILAVSHTGPDGDALGCLLSFYQVLKNQNKLVEMFINDDLPLDFNFLPHFNLIQDKKDLTNLTTKKIDLILALDCGSFDKSGLEEFLSKINYSPKIINIDHHTSNDNFGQLNLVDLTTSSTCEILYNLFNFLKIKINDKIATLLLTGIITDTDFFNNPNTNHQTLRTASQLLSQGAKLNLIFKSIYKKTGIRNLRLWGKALSRLSIDKKSQIATTVIFQDDFDFDFSQSAFEGFANFLNSLEGVRSVLVLKEEDGQMIKGSLRTTRDDVDVIEIAKEYGGGGHKKAAGFRVKGRIVKSEDGEWRIERSN